MGDTEGGYMRSGRVAESSTTGGSVSSPGHGVQTMYAGSSSPSLSVVYASVHPEEVPANLDASHLSQA